MGTNSLETKADGDVIEAADPNQYKEALGINLLPRDVSGVPTDLGGGLGDTLRRWNTSYIKKIYFGEADEECSIENTGDNITIKVNDTVAMVINATGFDGGYVDPATGKRLQCRKYETVGDHTVDFPTDTNTFLTIGAGGGGAGGQGGQGNDANDNGGGGGGGGGASIFTGPYICHYNQPNQAIVHVGNGGQTSGADGEASTITGIDGSVTSLYFPGAEGGDTGGTGVEPQTQGAGGDILIWDGQIDSFPTNCGPGGAGAYNAAGTMGAASQAPSYKLVYGGTIAAGGAAGLHGTNAPGTDDDHGGGGGGGARSIFANGGAGGNGQSNAGTGQTAGADAGGAMAGGGGGGGGREAGGGAAGAAGGKGGRGTVWIFCVTSEAWEGTV